MTPEQKQQLEQIQQSTKRLKVMRDTEDLLESTDTERAYENTINDLLGDIDFLLFLVKSQEAGGEAAVRLLAAERVANAARNFCEEVQEDAEGIPQQQLLELNTALDAWEAYPDARESFDDSRPVQAALASLIEDGHATDHQRRVGRLALDALRNYEDELDKELRRWQDGIRDELLRLGAPDWKVDGGAGAESGDPLDFTLSEVMQGCGWFIDRADSAATSMRSRCVEKVKARAAEHEDEGRTTQRDLLLELAIDLESVSIQEKPEAACGAPRPDDGSECAFGFCPRPRDGCSEYCIDHHTALCALQEREVKQS